MRNWRWSSFWCGLLANPGVVIAILLDIVDCNALIAIELFFNSIYTFEDTVPCPSEIMV